MFLLETFSTVSLHEWFRESIYAVWCVLSRLSITEDSKIAVFSSKTSQTQIIISKSHSEIALWNRKCKRSLNTFYSKMPKIWGWSVQHRSQTWAAHLSVTELIDINTMNLVTLKAAAKYVRLFNKPASLQFHKLLLQGISWHIHKR